MFHKLNIYATIFFVFGFVHLDAQLKVASCSQGSNRFGNISTALDANEVYVGGTPSSCNMGSVNINNANDTVIVREGTTVTRSNLNSNVNGVVIVFGDLDLEQGNQSLNINSNGQLLVYGTITGGNNTSIINNGVFFVDEDALVSTGNGPNASIVINGAGVSEINGVVTTPNLTNNGTIVGTGIIYGDITNQGSINGSTDIISTVVTPLGTSPETALTWMSGPQWNNSPPGQGNNNRQGLALLIEELFEVGVNPGDFDRRFSKITVKNNKSFKANGSYVYTNKIQLDNGIFEFSCNSRLYPKTAVEGNGNSEINLVNCLNWTGWHYFNFPVKTSSSLTLGDIDMDGSLDFVYDASSNARNIFQWDPTQSSWVSVALSESTTIGGKTFIYWGSNGGSMTLAVSPADFNNAAQSAPMAYHNPGPAATPPGGSNGWSSAVTDGWVMIPNPFQDDIDWNNVRNDIIANYGIDFEETAVYVWNGSTYDAWNGSGSSARYVSPYTPVFVRVSSSVSSSFEMKNNYRRANPITSAAREAQSQTSLFLDVQGQGFTVSTEIAEAPLSTIDFDGHFDAHYMEPMSNAPLFFSVTNDSMAVSVNQIPDLEDTVVVSFSNIQNNKSFTLSMRGNQLPPFVNVMLLDTYTNDLVDLNQEDYSFLSDENAPVERFRLFVQKNGLHTDQEPTADEAQNPKLRVWFAHDKVNIESSKPLRNAQVYLVNMAGQTVVNQTFSNLSAGSIPVQIPSGVYVIWVQSLDGSQKTKIVNH